MLKVTFIALDGSRYNVNVPAGFTILEAAQSNGVPMLGTCGGSMICSTCHVKINLQQRKLLPEPSEDEENTLDLAFGVTADSRLGCQVYLTAELDELEILLTSTSPNDFSPT